MLMFTHEVLPFETDMYGYLRPSQMLRYAMHASALRLYTDKLDVAVEKSGLNTGWMLARIRNEQALPVRAGDVLQIFCSQRAVQGAAYIRQVSILRDGELVSECLLMWILIDMDRRRIMRVTEIEKYTDADVSPIELPDIPRIIHRGEMEKLAEIPVLRSQCDVNGHLSTANYLDIVCDACGFWKDGPKHISRVRLDFHSEFMPEEMLEIHTAAEGTQTLVRGVHTGGAVGFTAAFETEQVCLDMSR